MTSKMIKITGWMANANPETKEKLAGREISKYARVFGQLGYSGGQSLMVFETHAQARFYSTIALPLKVEITIKACGNE